MLFISIPKSACTSLIATISHAHGKRIEVMLDTASTAAREYPELAAIHPSVREHQAEFRKWVDREDVVFRYHLPPTARNLEILKAVKKVIVLRDPLEIPAAYCREARHGYRPLSPVFGGCRTEQEWTRRAVESGLMRELQQFHAGWLAAEGAETLIVQYRDLIDPAKTGEVIRRVEKFFGLEPSGLAALRRELFTGAGGPEGGWKRRVKSAVRRVRRLWD